MENYLENFREYLRKRSKTLKIMKLSLMLMILGIMQVSASVYSQNKKISVQVIEEEFKDLLWELKESSGLVFIYKSSDLKDLDKVTLETQDASISEILDQILKGTNLEYSLDDDVVIIKRKPAKAVVLPIEVEKKKPARSVVSPIEVQQKKKVIKGTVKDTDGNTLPGVSVVLKGTSTGVSTDIDGKYSLDISDFENVNLVFSFIGMIPQEILIGNQKEVNVILLSSSEQLNEIVVTGYQKIDRRLFTGAATRLKMEDVKLSSESDISKSLEGQVAGVSVQNVSSTFGSAPKIRVRGASSIYGNQKPLWVVDGIVLEDAVEVSMDDLSSGNLSTILSSGVAGLNMDDIESFQILKDVSATALYGARAMNGVIVITTKKGKQGKLDINYSMGLTLKPRPSYNDYNILNSKDQMSINRELYEKGWTNISKTQFDATHGAYGKMFDLIKENEINWGADNDQINSFLRKYETVNTNWFDELFQTGVQQQHTISLSGGGEKSKFYTSVGVLNDSGWTIVDKVKRYTALLKGSFNVTDKFTIITSSNMSFRDQELSGVSGSSVNKYTGKVDRSFENNPFMYAMTTSRNIRAYDENGDLEFFRRNRADYNVIDELSKNKTGVKVNDMTFTTDFNYKLFPNLILSSRFSARYYHAETVRKIHEDSNEANAYRVGIGPNDSEVLRDSNGLLYQKPNSTTGIKYSMLPEGGIYGVRNNSMENYYFNGSVNWNPRIGEDHMFTFLGGAEIRHINRSYNWSQGFGHFYDLGNISKPSPNYIEKLSMGSSSYFGKREGFDRFVAYYLNSGYSFKGKYTVNGTVRYDGSNRLGKTPTARWMPTWNMSSKWSLKEEEFLKDIEWLNLLNLRATYGLNGSLGNASNANLVAYASPTSRPLSPKSSELQIYISQLENSDLTWEKQYELNLGTDFSIFNNRISGEFNYYNRKAFDLIGKYISNGAGGLRVKWGNIADMDSQGYEVSLNFVPLKLKDFKWNLTANYSYNDSKIKELVSTQWVADATSMYGVPVSGGPVRGIYSSRFAGLDKGGVPTFYDRKNEKVHYLNVQTDDYSDFKYSGNLEPTTNLGISNRFSYKGLSLSVLVSGQFGHKKRVMQNFSYAYSDADALTSHLKNRWRVKGDETKTNIPTILNADFNNKVGAYKIRTAYNLYGMSDYWIADASFIRLKNISLSYVLPQTWIKKCGLKTARISMQASNVGLLWLADKEKLNGEDPEFVWSGGTSMPISKQFTFTLNVGF